MATVCVEASIGIANLLVMAMEQEGTDYDEARSKIFLTDSRGLVTVVSLSILFPATNIVKNVRSCVAVPTSVAYVAIVCLYVPCYS